MPRGNLPTHCKDCGMDLNLNPVYTDGYIRSRCKECFKNRYKKENEEIGFLSCKTCNQLKPSYEMKRLSSGYFLKICKDCFNEAQKRKRAEGDYEKYKGRYKDTMREWKLNTKYGITTEEFNRKLELQLNGCAICKEEFKSREDAKVDHNHITGKVRDLLCLKCNFLIGFSREDEDLIWALLEYLKQHEEFRKEESFEVINVNE